MLKNSSHKMKINVWKQWKVINLQVSLMKPEHKLYIYFVEGATYFSNFWSFSSWNQLENRRNAWFQYIWQSYVSFWLAFIYYCNYSCVLVMFEII